MQFKFQLLGPIVVTIGNEPVTLRSPMLKGLLAVLCLQANRFVSTDDLTMALWDMPPSAARSNLRTYAARLRQSLHCEAPDSCERLATERSLGYRLEVWPQELDHQEFHDLACIGRAELRSGDFAAARGSLTRALSLWRGHAGDDAPRHSRIGGQLRTLNEARLLATEDLNEARLALDDSDGLVGELREHVGNYPFRERPHSQLMRALYRDGDPTGALLVYDQLRRTLAEELGTAPSPELQLLHQAVLRHEVPASAHL
jgi:DNA-binding SARP family transcriptional activator